MVDILNETFEAVGGDHASWISYKVGGTGSSILDLDYDTSLVSGTPASWGSKCLRSNGATNELSRVYKSLCGEHQVIDFSGESIYLFSSNSYGNYYNRLGTLASNCFVVSPPATYNPDSMYLTLEVWEDGVTGATHQSTTQVNRNTKFTNRVKWDTVSKIWEWYLDGVLQASGSLSSGAVGASYIHCGGSFISRSETFFDNLSITVPDNTSLSLPFSPCLYGDDPQYSSVANSWPKYSKLGGIFVGAGGGIGRYTVPKYKKDLIAKREILLRDDNELLDIITMLLQDGFFK